MEYSEHIGLMCFAFSVKKLIRDIYCIIDLVVP
jgi:hypothetical protein